MYRILLLTLLACCSTALTAQNEPTLVAHYPFNRNANDVSGFGNHATVGGATLTEGYNGEANGAYSFDGDRDSIFAPAAPQLNTPNATYAFWVKVDSLVRSGEYYLFSYGGYQDRVKMSLPSHGYPVFTTNGDGGTKDGDTNPESIMPDVWTHLTFVRARDTNFIYINGQLAKFESDDKTRGSLGTTNKVLGIGYDAAFTGSYFSGDVDDVRVYDSGMTRAQVAALYNSLLVSLQEVRFAELGKVFPNPASRALYFEHSMATDGSVHYELIDALGRITQRGVVTQQLQPFDVSAETPGLYTLLVRDREQRGAARVIIE